MIVIYLYLLVFIFLFFALFFTFAKDNLETNNLRLGTLLEYLVVSFIFAAVSPVGIFILIEEYTEIKLSKLISDIGDIKILNKDKE